MGDVVTQLQQQVNDLWSLFFHFAGALQRDAPKAKISSESVIQDSNFDVKKNCEIMVTQLMDASKAIDHVIGQLPDVSQSFEERQQRVTDLWKKYSELGVELNTEVENLEAVLHELQEMYGVIVEAKLSEVRVSACDQEPGGDDEDMCIDEVKQEQ